MKFGMNLLGMNIKKRFHEPVLLKEAIEYLSIKPGEKYIDATVGGGGGTGGSSATSPLPAINAPAVEGVGVGGAT